MIFLTRTTPLREHYQQWTKCSNATHNVGDHILTTALYLYERDLQTHHHWDTLLICGTILLPFGYCNVTINTWRHYFWNFSYTYIHTYTYIHVYTHIYIYFGRQTLHIKVFDILDTFRRQNWAKYKIRSFQGVWGSVCTAVRYFWDSNNPHALCLRLL